MRTEVGEVKIFELKEVTADYFDFLCVLLLPSLYIHNTFVIYS